MSASVSAKDGPTYYTPERVLNAQRNIEAYEWAKRTFATIKGGQGFRYYIGPECGPADVYADKGDKFMWLLMPTTRIARHVPKAHKAHSPGCTEKLRQTDPWCGLTIDPINHPYKVRCKACGTWYPTNDYHLGDMTSGEYPDDGNGCRRDGTVYYFLREYAHMCYGSAVVPALRSLSQAWVLTGDKRYGRAGCILLARLAAEYPNHGDRKDRLFYAIYENVRDPGVSWKLGGMITDLIWETGMLEETALAYDGLYSYMDQDPGMLEFLQRKGLPAATADDLRRYVEDHILRSGVEALLLGHIHGNPGMHQAAALAVALVLDDYRDSPDNPFNSRRAVDYMVSFQHPQWQHVGHSGMLLTNGSDRNGGGHESPNYARSRLDLINVNRYMDSIRARRPALFPVEAYPDLFMLPKARRIFDFYLDVTVHGYFLPSIGDCGGIAAPRRVPPQPYSYLPSEKFLYAFGKYGDPRHGRACTAIETGGLAKGSLFEDYPEAEIRAASADPASKIEWASRLLDGYGVGLLDSGAAQHRRAAMLNYANLQGHAQCDQLHVQLWARGVDFLPDLGYPVSWAYRWTWDSNSMAHNTVTVDETQPILNPTGGRGRLFASAGGVHVVSATHNPYPDGRKQLGRADAKQTDLFQRTLVLVDVVDERFYVVDHFAVNGRQQHDQSWHGLLVPPAPPQLAWRKQAGTLAGPDVKQFEEWTDKWGRERKDFPCFLADIETADLAEPAAWTWESGLPEGDGLRLHLVPVGGPMQVIQGRGRSPARPSDWWLHYVFARRQATDGGASQFVTVIDGYQKEPVVLGVRLVSEEPVVLEVEHSRGVDTVEVNVPLAASNHTRPIEMGLRVRSDRGDVRVGVCNDGSGYARATIVAVDYANHRVAVPWNEAAASGFVQGATMRVYNDDRSALYRITAARRDGDQLWLTLDATALVARGRVLDVADGQLILDAFLTFADGVGPYNTFAGSWLGDDSDAVRIRGASHGHTNVICLQDETAADDLRERYIGKTVSVWQYARGDHVEAARVLCAE